MSWTPTDAVPTLYRAQRPVVVASTTLLTSETEELTLQLRGPVRSEVRPESAPTVSDSDGNFSGLSDQDLGSRLQAETQYLQALRRERAQLVQKLESSPQEKRRRQVVEWILNRAETARLQPDLNRLERHVESYEALAADVKDFVRALGSNARRHSAKAG